MSSVPKTRSQWPDWQWLALVPVTALLVAAAPRIPDYQNHQNLMVVRDAEGREAPVKTCADWEVRRAQIVAHLQEVMGSAPSAREGFHRMSSWSSRLTRGSSRGRKSPSPANRATASPPGCCFRKSRTACPGHALPAPDRQDRQG